MNINWTEAWAVVLTGIVVVFVALILLIVVVWVFSKIFDKAPKKAPAPKKAAPAPAAPKAAPQVTVAAPAADGENMDEIAAAITAALAVILAEEGAGKSFVVKSIKRVRNGGSAWRNAGLADTVRPF